VKEYEEELEVKLNPIFDSEFSFTSVISAAFIKIFFAIFKLICFLASFYPFLQNSTVFLASRTLLSTELGTMKLKHSFDVLEIPQITFTSRSEFHVLLLQFHSTPLPSKNDLLNRNDDFPLLIKPAILAQGLRLS
jgi:hypothetical protein